jgi:tRNA nucleotidyltransferase (CCA-adding enzyme)
LVRIPVERFSREMLKAFSSPAPQQFFQAMLEFSTGRCWLPELFRMPLVPAGPLHYHPEGDLLAHSLEVLERVSTRTADPLARFCAFFHDIGKLSTDEAFYPRHFDHEETGFAMAFELCKRLALPGSYAKALAWTSRLHGKVNKFEELRPATRIRVAEKAIKAGITEILPLVALADKPGNGIDQEWRQTVFVAVMNAAQLDIDSEKMNALPPVKRAEFILQKRVERLKAIFLCEERDFF